MSFAVEVLEEASAFIVNGGPILGDYDLNDERLVFSWVEHEGETEVVVSRSALEKAEFRGSSFFVTDADGDTAEVEVFRLQPTYPVPPSFVDGWLSLFGKMDGEGVVPAMLLEPAMDSMVDCYIGGGDSEAINSQGRQQQIKALYAAFEGDVSVMSNALAFRLSCCTAYSQPAWQSVLLNFASVVSVKVALGKPWEAS